MSENTSNALTLVMTIKSESDYQVLKTLIDGLQGNPSESPIRKALTKLGLVHFARFVFLSNNTQLAIITTYDGDFDRYIDAFVNEIGDVFDKIFAHVKDAPAQPIKDHRQAFADYIKKHDAPSAGGLYCAYPDLTVVDILRLQAKQA